MRLGTEEDKLPPSLSKFLEHGEGDDEDNKGDGEDKSGEE